MRSPGFKRSWLESRQGFTAPLRQLEYRVYGDLVIIYPKPYSIYLRGTIRFRVRFQEGSRAHEGCEIYLIYGSFPKLAYPNIGPNIL